MISHLELNKFETVPFFRSRNLSAGLCVAESKNKETAGVTSDRQFGLQAFLKLSGADQFRPYKVRLHVKKKKMNNFNTKVE